MGKPKVSIIGAGFVGGETAYLLAQKNICDIVLLDIIQGVPQGKALDINQSASIIGFDTKITGTNNYEDITDSDIVVITAGIARKPGMSRDDLLGINAKIMHEAATKIKKYSQNSIIIVISNPLDAMAHIAKIVSGFPKNKIIGMAGVLDCARFKTFISEETGVSPQKIDAIILGGHGDEMVPLSRLAKINGVPLRNILSDEKIRNIEEKTRKGGAQIVELLKTGSAYFTPSASAVQMIESILQDKKIILPVSAWLEGEYGYNNLFLGVPVVLGRDGVEKIVELELNEEEKLALEKTAKKVEEQSSAAQNIIKNMGGDK